MTTHEDAGLDALLGIQHDERMAERDAAPPGAGGGAAETVLAHLAKHFTVLAEVCEREGAPYAPAYRNAAEDMRACLTGGYGWMLGLQDALRALAAPPAPACDCASCRAARETRSPYSCCPQRLTHGAFCICGATIAEAPPAPAGFTACPNPHCDGHGRLREAPNGGCAVCEGGTALDPAPVSHAPCWSGLWKRLARRLRHDARAYRVLLPEFQARGHTILLLRSKLAAAEARAIAAASPAPAPAPGAADARAREAYPGELAALREDKARLDILSLPTTSGRGTTIGVCAPGFLPGASLYYDGDTDAWDGATLRDCIDSLRAVRRAPAAASDSALLDKLAASKWTVEHYPDSPAWVLVAAFDGRPSAHDDEDAPRDLREILRALTDPAARRAAGEVGHE